MVIFEDASPLAAGTIAGLLLAGEWAYLPAARAKAIASRQAEIVRGLAELAIASLPDGPWVMTTRDVAAFLDLILEGT